VLAALGPSIVAAAHECLAGAGDGGGRTGASVAEMPAEDAALVVEAIKALVAGANLVASMGSAASQAPAEGLQQVMRVLVALLVESAAPAPGALSSPSVRDMAIRLITSLPTSATLGEWLKQQLLLCLPYDARVLGSRSLLQTHPVVLAMLLLLTCGSA
jgi:hypothetical protein